MAYNPRIIGEPIYVFFVRTHEATWRNAREIFLKYRVQMAHAKKKNKHADQTNKLF